MFYPKVNLDTLASTQPSHFQSSQSTNNNLLRKTTRCDSWPYDASPPDTESPPRSLTRTSLFSLCCCRCCLLPATIAVAPLCPLADLYSFQTSLLVGEPPGVARTLSRRSLGGWWGKNKGRFYQPKEKTRRKLGMGKQLCAMKSYICCIGSVWCAQAFSM